MSTRSMILAAALMAAVMLACAVNHGPEVLVRVDEVCGDCANARVAPCGTCAGSGGRDEACCACGGAGELTCGACRERPPR